MYVRLIVAIVHLFCELVQLVSEVAYETVLNLQSHIYVGSVNFLLKHNRIIKIVNVGSSSLRTQIYKVLIIYFVLLQIYKDIA